jgi:hypothetical protein
LADFPDFQAIFPSALQSVTFGLLFWQSGAVTKNKFCVKAALF